MNRKSKVFSLLAGSRSDQRSDPQSPRIIGFTYDLFRSQRFTQTTLPKPLWLRVAECHLSIGLCKGPKQGFPDLLPSFRSPSPAYPNPWTESLNRIPETITATGPSEWTRYILNWLKRKKARLQEISTRKFVNFLGIENVDFTANQFSERFLVSPSLTTRVVIRGGENDLEFSSLFRLQTQFNPISTLVGPFSGFNTYLFDSGFQNIFIQV